MNIGGFVMIRLAPLMAQAPLAQGAESRPSSAQEFGDYLKSQMEFFAKIVADAGIKPE